MVDYDGAVIEELAARLYAEANRVAGAWFVMMGGGGLLLAYLSTQVANAGPVVSVFLAVAGVVLGWRMGRARAFALRLRAQVALCQVAIERNTRRTP